MTTLTPHFTQVFHVDKLKLYSEQKQAKEVTQNPVKDLS